MEIKNIEPRAMYTMFDIQFNHKGIIYFENVISYPETLLSLMEKLDQDPRSYNSIPKWHSWGASNDSEFSYGDQKFIDTSKRNIDTGDDLLNKQILYVINSLMMAPEMCAKKFAEMQKYDSGRINNVQKVDGGSIEEIVNARGFSLEDDKLGLDYIKVAKYTTGKGMGPHCDAEDPTGTGQNLRYSLVCYLNDDYEGGEIYFKNQDVKIKPKAGSLVFFPSTHPYLHESLPVTKGRKVMYTTHWMV